MRKRIRPPSRSVISSETWLNETLAPFTTARSDARAPSRAMKPWSRTATVFSVNCSGMTATGKSSLAGVHVGTSGWSYPSWKPGFYPAGTDSKEFLAYYSQRFSTVELNTTDYRLPAEEQFVRWAEQTPPGFTFAPKLAGNRPRIVAEFGARVRLLGERLGPTRVSLKSARDEGMLELILGSLDAGTLVAFDLEHGSWDGIEPRLAEAGAVRVNDLDHEAPFRYVRFRDPPYADEDLEQWAARLREVKEPVFAYFRHEDEPTAPAYARRLLELLAQ